jgi:hypothetical protein
LPRRRQAHADSDRSNRGHDRRHTRAQRCRPTMGRHFNTYRLTPTAQSPAVATRLACARPRPARGEAPGRTPAGESRRDGSRRETRNPH